MSRPELRHVVAEAELRLAALLERWGEQAIRAFADGRVFVDGRRADDPEALLAPGSQVELYRAREARGEQEELRVLARMGGLVAVEKPAGLSTEPDRSGISGTVVSQVAELFGVARDGVHALSRLDVGVSGVVLLGLDSEARRQVESWRASSVLKRRYVAIAAGVPDPKRGSWRGAIGRGRGQRRAVGGSDSRAAHTRYVVAATVGGQSLLGLEPVTGRTHQLRVHAADSGAPLYGDSTYGGPKRVVAPDGGVQGLRRIALHAAWVLLPLGSGLRIEAPVPSELFGLWTALGGSEADFQGALADPIGESA